MKMTPLHHNKLLWAVVFSLSFAFLGCSESKDEASNNGQDTGGGGDINPPLDVTDPLIVINDDGEFTALAQVQIKATAGNANEVYLTTDSTCTTGGSWADVNQVQNFTLPELNKAVKVYGKFRTPEGAESECVFDEITHDDVAPSLAFTGGTSSGAVSSQTKFTFEYTVTEAGSGLQNFGCTVNGTDTACQSSSPLEVTVAQTGSHELKISMSDKAGNSSSATLSWNVVPAIGVVSFSIDNGAAYTQSTNVNLGFMAEHATLFKLSHDDQCSDGTFENYVTSKSFTLENSNAENNVYAQYSNAAGDRSPCLKASILHDDVKPTLNMTNAPNENSVVTQLLPVSLTITDGGSGLNSHECLVDSVNVTCAASGDFDLGTLAEGDHELVVKVQDKAGNNEMVTRHFTYLKPLGAASLVIDGGAVYSNDSAGNVTLTLTAQNAKEMYITNHSTCENGGVWEAYSSSKPNWNLGLLNQGETSVYVKFRNTEHLVSPCVSASIIHDSIPYSLVFSDPLPIYVEGKKNVLKYKIMDGAKELTGFNEVASFDGCEIEANSQWSPLACPTFGSIDLSSLKVGAYKVKMSAKDHAGNGSVTIVSFEVKLDYPLCSDPIFDGATHIGQCLSFVDSFERSAPVSTTVKNWMTIIDDVARNQNDKVNVQANIIKQNQYKFGPAVDLDRALYFTGRKGKSFNKVFMISQVLNLQKFDHLQVDFNYLPIKLEKYKLSGVLAPENIKLEVCTSTPENCGAYVLPANATASQKQKQAAALKSAHWKPFFEQPGSGSGQLSAIEAGIKNDGRNHSRSTWLLGSGLIDLNSNLIANKAQVVFRFTVSIDEGFRSVLATGRPNLNSTLEDGMGIDLVKVLALQNE